MVERARREITVKWRHCEALNKTFNRQSNSNESNRQTGLLSLRECFCVWGRTSDWHKRKAAITLSFLRVENPLNCGLSKINVNVTQTRFVSAVNIIKENCADRVEKKLAFLICEHILTWARVRNTANVYLITYTSWGREYLSLLCRFEKLKTVFFGRAHIWSTTGLRLFM